MPLRFGLAGTLTTVIFSRPGRVNAPAPFLLTEACTVLSSEDMTARTSRAATPVDSLMWATRPDLLSTSLIGFAAAGLAAFGAAFFDAAFFFAMVMMVPLVIGGWVPGDPPRQAECRATPTRRQVPGGAFLRVFSGVVPGRDGRGRHRRSVRLRWMRTGSPMRGSCCDARIAVKPLFRFDSPGVSARCWRAAPAPRPAPCRGQSSSGRGFQVSTSFCWTCEGRGS